MGGDNRRSFRAIPAQPSGLLLPPVPFRRTQPTDAFHDEHALQEAAPCLVEGEIQELLSLDLVADFDNP